MKRLFSLLLLCVLLLGSLSVCAESYSDIAAEGQAQLCGNNLSWYVSGTTLHITGQGDMYDFPNGAPWAEYKYSLTQVILGDEVTSVGAYAFTDYDQLGSVLFGSSFVQIGAWAFQSCDGLTSLSLPKTFKKFGESCLRSCPNLREIHCSGNFPRFDENSLWDTYCTIYYSTDNPWSVSLIQQLEEAFHNRIEFRASDGTDPYVPTEATVYVPEATEYVPDAPTSTAPTTPPIIVTRPTEAPVQTTPTVPPTAAPTEPPAAQPTEPTFLISNQPTQETSPETRRGTDGNSIFGVLIIVIMLAIIATSSLLFRLSRQSGQRKKRKKNRSNRYSR